MELLQHLRKNPFVLAPMAGITDHPFRSFMRKRGAGVVVTELISATGCLYKNEKTLSLMSFSESQRPIGIQLFGEDPLVMAEAAKIAEDRGCDFIDLNFGCPVP
ncbi:MAG: tRNA-dihydrouridine synthase family protein, partial [Bdellovibrionaceae bacterium]|nr:tRNA-dihydrouridine synthase family protein [Pseudobdellovibrionaceae bacterium]